MENGFGDISPVSRERFVPANPEAEQAVLGSLLIDPDAVIKVAAFLKAEDFYQEKNGWIYQTIIDLHERLEALHRARPPHHVRVLVAHRLQRPREGAAHPQPSGEPEPEAQRHSTNWSPSQF